VGVSESAFVLFFLEFSIPFPEVRTMNPILRLVTDDSLTVPMLTLRYRAYFYSHISISFLSLIINNIKKGGCGV